MASRNHLGAQVADHIGGSARDYQELFTPLAIPATAERHADGPVYLCSTALGANARFCRDEWYPG
jgi:hypothetical protein